MLGTPPNGPHSRGCVDRVPYRRLLHLRGPITTLYGHSDPPFNVEPLSAAAPATEVTRTASRGVVTPQGRGQPQHFDRSSNVDRDSRPLWKHRDYNGFMRTSHRRFAPAALTAAAAMVMSLGACAGAAPPPRAAPVSESKPSPVPLATTTSPRPPQPSATTSTTPSSPSAPAPTAQGPRPSNGQIFVQQNNGEGELVVENGTSHDSYVTLAAGPVAASAVYVRAQETARIRGIADGDYTVYFASGNGWNSDLRRFTADVRAHRFEDTFAYSTTPTSSTEWTVTLQPVEGGTARTTTVPPDAIPR